jgi:hypothetical protein
MATLQFLQVTEVSFDDLNDRPVAAFGVLLHGFGRGTWGTSNRWPLRLVISKEPLHPFDAVFNKAATIQKSR